MKNTIFKLVSFFVLFLFAQNILAQRNVAWVHGLDGDAGSWQHYNAIFDAERNINSLRTSYNTDNGITHASNQVKNSMDTFYGSNANNPLNLGIGHSMGGLMIRDVDRLTPSTNKRFGGYVTVTSPNYGAPIANSLMDGSVQNAAANACNKLNDGPLSEIFSLPYGITANLTTNVLCNKFISNDLVQDMIGTPITNYDLRVGSPTIEALKNHTNNSNIPRISIWAQESSPVHWRMFSSSEFNNDQTLVNYVNDAREIYNVFFMLNTSLAMACGVGGFWFPPCWAASALYTYRATQWYKGRSWIDDSENIWNSLIKTTRSEQQTYWAYIWIPCSYPPSLVEEKNPNPNCGQWEWREFTRWVSVNYPSDGLLPKYTQELQNIPTGNRYYVPGANHLEVRNMSNSTLNGQPNDVTKARFNEIFNRPQGDWFRTN
ncbi:MAG: hypothetical protein U1C46_09255 [Bacteroidales bacterium]|nr:hypothetical protein [Bacteroidales bacterium]MDZ4204990.1 hypothetical protein [Bacteroidales bacterium]